MGPVGRLALPEYVPEDGLGTGHGGAWPMGGSGADRPDGGACALEPRAAPEESEKGGNEGSGK